ncbi:multidrug efflux SMR transporter [uncultured Thiothrix sp.]|uniref:DMT family transporter n=1 Tax=uncultured Thiothrix sp. TaxID=223185 RepID=UPI0026309E03|nr:SMR family transporter [uncultured Thiothrix sp.]
MGWLYLLAAGAAGIGFSTFLKLSDNFSKTGPTIGFISFSALSFWLLTKALHTIPLGTAYGVWAGIGAFGTAITGIIYF